MRLKIAVLVWKTLLALAGAALPAGALFAMQLGIDNDPGWGRGRVAMAAAGGLLLGGAVITHFWQRIRTWGMVRSLAAAPARAAGWLEGTPLARGLNRLSAGWQSLPPVAYLRCHPRLDAAISAGLGVLLTLLAYVWYLTAGTMTTWTPYTSYFDRLGQAFLAGQVALLEKPSPELLALENPYDWRAREGIPQLWDATLYQGRYYLYWGPVPGLVAAGMRAVTGAVIEDQALILLFCGGLVIVFALTLALLREKLFPHAPAWTLLLLTLFCGLSVPLLWLVNRPSVYETAIAGGQFFLFLGLYAALRALLGAGNPRGWLALAGFAWGAAVNCRLNLAFAVGVFCLVIAWLALMRGQQKAGWRARLREVDWRSAASVLLPLALPLLLWAAGLGWYNYARFGSPLETGHRYQLTGPALPADYRHVTSLAYALPSLYSYLARPLQVNGSEFPFVFAPYIRESMWPFFIRLPEHYYYPEPVAGLPLIAPGVWLALLPVAGLLRRAWGWLHEDYTVRSSEAVENDNALPGWLWALTWGGLLALFAPLLVFISTSMRYLADVTPMLALLSALGLWWGLRACRAHPWRRGGLILLALALLLVSIAIGLLLNFTNGDQRFAANNPALYQAIAHFFTPLTPGP